MSQRLSTVSSNTWAFAMAASSTRFARAAVVPWSLCHRRTASRRANAWRALIAYLSRKLFLVASSCCEGGVLFVSRRDWW